MLQLAWGKFSQIHGATGLGIARGALTIANPRAEGSAATPGMPPGGKICSHASGNRQAPMEKIGSRRVIPAAYLYQLSH